MPKKRFTRIHSKPSEPSPKQKVAAPQIGFAPVQPALPSLLRQAHWASATVSPGDATHLQRSSRNRGIRILAAGRVIAKGDHNTLLAHELTHGVQQNGPAVQQKREE